MEESSNGNQADNKSKKQIIDKQGVVLELLPNATFKVKLDDESEVLAHLSGKMRLNLIRVLRGDRVAVEVSEYDTAKGRITRRF